jgi:hypothetical protein
MKRALAVATILGAAWAAGAGASGGPSPGAVSGPPGVVDSTGTIRYVAVPAGRSATIVEALATHGGTLNQWRRLRGSFGVPQVAWDGSMGGVSRDGIRLVLVSPLGQRSTSFVLLDTGSLQVRSRVRLRGSFAFDALSPDGSLMYLIQYLGAPYGPAYAVRAFNWNTRTLYRKPVVDAREPNEKMNGQPMTRAGSTTGWAYTLYQRPGGRPFVHALDTVHRRAFCVDLPWRNSANWISTVRMRVRRGMLELRRDGHTIARMNRRTLKVES